MGRVRRQFFLDAEGLPLRIAPSGFAVHHSAVVVHHPRHEAVLHHHQHHQLVAKPMDTEMPETGGDPVPIPPAPPAPTPPVNTPDPDYPVTGGGINVGPGS